MEKDVQFTVTEEEMEECAELFMVQEDSGSRIAIDRKRRHM